MNEKLLKIMKTYGIEHQLKHFNSEVFELNEAVLNYEITSLIKDLAEDDGNNSNYDHIVEELADVLVMLNQFILYYEIDHSKIKEVMRNKVDRQIKRINE